MGIVPYYIVCSKIGVKLVPAFWLMAVHLLRLGGALICCYTLQIVWPLSLALI